MSVPPNTSFENLIFISLSIVQSLGAHRKSVKTCRVRVHIVDSVFKSQEVNKEPAKSPYGS